MTSMPVTFPSLLARGDKVAVIAPSRSFDIIAEETYAIIKGRFSDLGLELALMPHISAANKTRVPVKDRVADLNAAFADPAIKAIICVMGGFHANDLLPFIDYEVVRRNPKIFIGFSDITALQNTFLAKTGLVTYHGPNLGSFGMKKGATYYLEAFKRALMTPGNYDLDMSAEWSNDAWYLDQENRVFHKNAGPLVLRAGKAAGQLIGGNLSTIALLHGTPYMPKAKNVILFIEEDDLAGEDTISLFVRNLRALMQQEAFHSIKGLCLGRFQLDAKVDLPALYAQILEVPGLESLPVVADLDFGHTVPIGFLPIGAQAEVIAEAGKARISFKRP